MRRIAVVGSGIAGLAAAHRLNRHARITLFEAGRHFGGHTNTIDLTLDGVTHGVDTGFLVFNERTYPNLIRLFGELGIAGVPSEMSFSMQVHPEGIEWSGSSLDAVFAQRANLFEPRFLGMLAELLRFNRLATRIAERGGEQHLSMSIGEFLDAHRFGNAFRELYLLPMIGCIWSCPIDRMLRFPAATLIRFCHNHGLLQLTRRPRWLTVAGGARRYVQRIVEALPDVRLECPVRRVRRVPQARGDSVWLDTDAGAERFDDVVLACHSDQALALLDAPSALERELLGAIGYRRNRAVLHTDAALLPRRRRAWAAWNCERVAGDGGRDGICLHYLINRLQPLPWATPVIVSLNPLREPAAARVHAEIDYEHPVFDAAAIAAQPRIGELQGRSHVWFCGAWIGYGFHEDGVVSGLAVANALIERMTRAAPQQQAAA